MKIKINWKILGIILFIIASLKVSLNILDTGCDYYWHVKLGEYIINTKAVPTTDIFSWYGILNNLPWVSHEWLSGVILYLNSTIFGKYAPLIFCTTIYLTIALLLFYLNKKEYLKNSKFTLIHILIGTILLSASITPRPHLISYVLLILTLYLTKDFYNNPETKKIFFLPLISLIWANAHGGSSNLTYIILGITFIGSILDKKMNKKLLRKYLLIFTITTLIITINPHGLKMLLYPYSNLLDTTMKNGITEWQRPTIDKLNNLLMFIYILGIIILFIKKRKSLKKKDLLIFLAFSYLSISAIRFIPFIYLAATFFIFDYIEPCEIGLINYKLITLASITSIIISIFTLPTVIKNTNIKIIDNQIINYLQKHQPSRLYNFYDYGGYLIYNDIKVFYDGRADIYTKNIFEKANNLASLKKDYSSFMKEYNFDYYLLPQYVPLTSYLLENDYDKIYDINNVVLLKKKALS